MAKADLIVTKQPVEWSYDEEADVLYLSFGEPTPAVGVDIGDGIVVRYDEQRRQVVGLTIIGLRARLETPEQAG